MNRYKGKRKTNTSAFFSTGRKMKDSNIEHCYEGKGTISNLLPHSGFIRTEKPHGETVSFDVFSFEDGKVKTLLDLPLKVGQEVSYLAKEGCDGSKAKYYAYHVWRPEYHKIFSESPSLGRNTAHSLSSSGRVSDMSYQDSMVSVTGSEKSNCYSSNTFSSMSEDTLEICSHTEEKHASGTCREAKKLIEQKGKIYPEGETKAQIIFGTPEEYVLVINDVVFYHEHPVTNLMWHIDDGECVKFDAVRNDSFSGFHWIAIMVWVGNRPKCFLTDDLKNKDNVEKLIKKYEHIFVSKCNSSSSLKYSVGENEGFQSKYEWGEASLSTNDTSSFTTYLSDDGNEKNRVSESQVGNSSSNGKSDCVSGILHEKFGREVIGEYLNTSCKKDSLVTLKKLSECVLTEENVTKDIPGLTEESVTKDIPGLTEESVTKDIPGLTEESVTKDIPGLTEESVMKDIPGLTEESVTKDIPGLMEENRLEPSVEMFERARNPHLKMDKKVEVFCTNTSSETVHKPHLPKCSPFIVSISGENKIGEVCDKAKSVKIRIVYLKSNTPGADKVKYPLLKNIAFAEGTVKSVNEFFVFLNIKNSVAPVFLSKIYLDGKEASKNNRNLKSIFEENELVYFAYMHALLSSNSEWVYVYLLWKGQKPKTFVEPSAEEFIEKFGFRNVILGSEIIPQNRQEEQISSGHKVLEVTYIKVKQDSSPQNKTKKISKAKVKKADTTNSKITTQKWLEFHEVSHKEDTQFHPKLRNTSSNRPEKSGAFSTSTSILKSSVCQSRSGSERVGKMYCSKTLESSQNMVTKDVLLTASVKMESTTETNVDEVGCLKTSESLLSHPLDKVTTTNSANLESTPETNADKVGYSREFDLKLKNCKGNKSNNRQNHSKEEDVKDVSEYIYNTTKHRESDVNRRSVISKPVPSQSDIDKDIHLLTLACLPDKKDKIRCNKNQNREQYECVSSSGHTSSGCSQKSNKENILIVSPLPVNVSQGLGETVLSAEYTTTASVSSLRSEVPSVMKHPVEDAPVQFETTGRVDVTSGGEAAGDCHGSLKFAIFSEDLLVQQVIEKVLAEMRKMSNQSWEAKPCMCLSQHKNVSNRSDASVQTDSVELVSDSAQTYATGEILFSQVFH